MNQAPDQSADVKLRISRLEARRFKRRWAAVNAAELGELRAMPLAKKALQTAALMESAKKLGWMEKLNSQVKEVRSRWNALKKAAGK